MRDYVLESLIRSEGWNQYRINCIWDTERNARSILFNWLMDMQYVGNTPKEWAIFNRSMDNVLAEQEEW